MKPKITEQTDLEDFTDPIVGINKNTTTKVNTEKKMDDFKGENQQEKPSNIVLDFIKKLSPLKIFNRNKKTEEEDDNPFDNNHSIITKEDTIKEKEETIINNAAKYFKSVLRINYDHAKTHTFLIHTYKYLSKFREAKKECDILYMLDRISYNTIDYCIN